MNGLVRLGYAASQPLGRPASAIGLLIAGPLLAIGAARIAPHTGVAHNRFEREACHLSQHRLA